MSVQNGGRENRRVLSPTGLDEGANQTEQHSTELDPETDFTQCFEQTRLSNYTASMTQATVSKAVLDRRPRYYEEFVDPNPPMLD